MEISIKIWIGIVAGWKPIIMIIRENGYYIKRIRDQKIKNSTSQPIFYSLENAILTNLTKPLEFCVETGDQKNYFRTETHEEKIIALNGLTTVIKGLSSKKAFSEDFNCYKEEISKKSVKAKNPFEEISVQMTFFQNLFIEMNTKLTAFADLIKESKLKKKEKLFLNILQSLSLIREEMKKEFDELIVKVFKYHDEREPENAFCKAKNKEEIEIDNELLNEIGSNPNDDIIAKSTIRNTQTIINIESNSIININSNVVVNNEIVRDSVLIDQIQGKVVGLEDLEEEEAGDIKNNKEKVELDLSPDQSHYECALYSPTQRRSQLVSEIQCSKNMRSEFMKCINMKKVILPIYFNEPISMLQKQCEKFYYCNFLNKASEETLPEMQILNICAFIIGEISFMSNRILKPFNPILGETFEYYDNQRKYRYFAEQVSHAPPITAFIGEGKSFALYGDTRSSTSFKLLKGAVELDFGNKVHLFLKTTKDYYVFTRPLLLMKGFILPPIRYDYSGTITISNVNNPSIHATMTFIEESKKIAGAFEGKIIKDNKPIYLIGGNWTSDCYYTDIEGNNKVNMLTIEDQDFFHNTLEKYKMPSYTCDFNSLTPELEKSLPRGDSRFRPDMRAYEEGKLDMAQELRMKVEKKQSLRHLKFEEDKIKYEPVYFKNENMPQSDDSVYCYIGGYWEDKQAKTHKPNDIFTID